MRDRLLAEGVPVVSAVVLVVVFCVKVVALTAVSMILLLTVMLGAAGRQVGGRKHYSSPGRRNAHS